VGTALKAAQATKDIGAEYRYLTLMGNGITEFGHPDQALVYFDRALAVVAQAGKDLSEPMLVYTGKTSALVALGRAAEAKELLEHALDVAKQSNSVGYQAEIGYQLGLLASKAGNTTEAARRFEEAVRLDEEVDGWRTVSQAQFELSKIYEAQRNLPAAERVAKEAVIASRRSADRFYLPRYLARQADIEIKLGRIREAKATYAEAEDVINGILVNASSPWTKSSLIAAMNDVFVGHLRSEIQFGQSPARVFHVVEEARGRPVADLLRTRRSAQAPQSAELTAAERKIAGLQIALQKTTVSRQRQRILDQLYETEQSMAPLTASANRWMRVATQPVELDQVQRSLAPDALLLEYVLDEPNSYCLVISRSSARIQKLANRSEIERRVKAMLKGLRNGKEISDESKQVYNVVLMPVEGDLARAHRLVVVPDGVLHQLPFEVLSDQRGAGVLQSYVVSYAPAGSVTALLTSRPTSPDSRRPLLAISAQPSGVGGSNSTDGAGKPFGSTLRGVYDLDKPEMPALPEANGEVRDVATILGKQSVVLLSATEADVKAQPLSEFAVMHFAVHGLTSTKFPERSTLVLRSDEARHEDGLLQAREILDLRLNADLVTLSACDSGSGEISGQDGVSSLARPFLVAGARSVVANLWSANDDFTRSLMKAFYTHLAAGEDEGWALRQAKLEMIWTFGKNATPYLWGGFILIGDSAIKLAVR
jgi:CHAT domain-containing protein